jgi:3'(2'), 5'-bisphosphate nucleotidase
MRRLADKVTEIARLAGSAIMDVYHEAPDSTSPRHVDKADGSPLTRADLAAHHLIANQLTRLDSAIPVVSEEDEGSLVWRRPAGRFWLVDPLDGTKEFIARNGEFTVNIALISDGKPVLGVVFAPALDEMYWGIPGDGAWKQADGKSEPIRVREAAHRGDALRIVASRSHMNEETEHLIASLGKHELVQAGSSLKFCRIADGSADVYPRLGPTCEWDTAAAQAVVEAAGGTVTTLDRSPLAYGKPDLLNPHFIVAAGAWALAGLS